MNLLHQGDGIVGEGSSKQIFHSKTEQVAEVLSSFHEPSNMPVHMSCSVSGDVNSEMCAEADMNFLLSNDVLEVCII